MKANDSTSFKTDNDGYIQTWGIVPIVDESMIYDAIDTEKISGRKRTDRLPLPPLPPPIPPVPTVSDYGPTCDPYKKTTVLPNNEEEANKERKRTCKKKHALVILVLLLVVIAIVAISIPIALHIHYTGRLGVGGCTSKIKRCHSCTCSNGRCPVNGQISSSKAYEYGEYDDCDGHCFTEVRKPDGNKTHRGCATSDPKWKSKPESHEIGCHTIQGSYVCFCCGEYCNKDDMTQYYSTACK
ncbi:hypothetical protein LOTGIDRAFT_231533 [Lottia gigantea]|uniref:Uncharacterized protein n=1 Tax=Lottia gigantea TaxID=225164 RepID=V4A0N4_LOTGI|nr:hypothetical protein LOTGIDRAFT_231533 [Lottia gigantea]ESO97338.1 hypothetical protein LOTGIDRAFT_231533 [Lottia gigantea]